MEARLARLESDVAHLRTDVADIKIDVRGLRDKVDAMAGRLDAKFDGAMQRFDTFKDSVSADHRKLSADLAVLKEGLAGAATKDGVIKEIASARESFGREIAAAKIWALVLYIALASGMFGTMARGFGWL